jgi:hypothetical protein
MGFQFTGIAVSKNLQQQPAQMEAILDEKLTFLAPICFESALSGRKPSNCCDIYFQSNCTLFFFATAREFFNQIAASKENQCQITSFSVSETAMCFYVCSYQKGAFLREMWSFPHEPIESEGCLFDGETAEDDGFSIVLKAIQQTIGHPLLEIELDCPAFRYQIGG